jgi:ABC-type multidrug transport system fused ATPase/permease subunit
MGRDGISRVGLQGTFLDVTRHYLWRLSPYFRQLSGLIVVGSLCGVVMNVAVVLPPLLLGNALNAAESLHRGTGSLSRVGYAVLALVAGSAATEVPRVGKRYWLGVARSRFSASVRADALRGVLTTWSTKEDTVRVGEVMSRVIGDVGVLSTGVNEVLVETWDTLLFSASLVVAMVVLDPVLAVWALAPVPVALWLAKRSGVLVARRTRISREGDAELTVALREGIGAMRVLRLFGRTRARGELVRTLAERRATSELGIIRLEEALGALYSTILTSGVVIVIWLGGRQVVAGSISIGGLVSFLALFTRFVTRSPRIPQMMNRIQSGGAAYARVAPLLAPPLAATADARRQRLSATFLPGAMSFLDPGVAPRRAAVELSFDHVTRSFEGASSPALHDFNLSVSAGAFVAVTGPVGSGKSTLARLAAGVVQPDAGEVSWGSHHGSTIDSADRARLVGYLDQEPHLFSGTVVENVAFWSSVPLTDNHSPVIDRAITLAALDRDVAEMPRGVRTEVGEMGVLVSGGQRQRLAFARALAAQGRLPGLLVLDDPFSALDVHTEAEIVANLRTAFGPSAPEEERVTILLVSHRLAAFHLADLVVVLDSGRAREVGTHTELIARGDLYARIARARAQLNGRPGEGGGVA